MIKIFNNALIKSGLKKESEYEYLHRLIDDSVKYNFGIDGNENLSGFLVCEAFENRFSPDIQISYRLASMIVSRAEIINLGLVLVFDKDSIEKSWRNENNDITTQDIGILRAISGFKIFGPKKDQSLSEYFESINNEDAKIEIELTSNILKIAEL
jgi:hypothetical protein